MSASDYGLNADEVERDLVEQIRELRVQRDAARAERDALRGLLTEARKATYSSDPEAWTNYLARIDAALAQKEANKLNRGAVE